MGARARVALSDPLQLDFFALALPDRPPTEFSPRHSALPPRLSSLVAPVVEFARKSEPKPQNYRITDSDCLGEGSLKAKCRANLEALGALKRIEAEGRPATQEEQKLLVRYVGWGGLPGVFHQDDARWDTERAALAELLSDEEMRSARATTLNAHYTSPTVIRAMYQLARHLGFTGGRVLEPACGIGHFLGLVPEQWECRFTGIEIDSVTARIAKLLYPESDIRHQPFEESKLAEGYFDLAISNVPFGDYRPFDPRFKSWNFVIHDYFFAAALKHLRPGGLLLFVTSRGTLDKADVTLREYLAQQADFLAAIRLPNTTFERNAHTQVTTDIVVLRKRLPDEPRGGHRWRDLSQITNSLGEKIAVNEWFAAHPEFMLGEMQLSGRMYRRSEPTLVDRGTDLSEELLRVIPLFPAGVFSPAEKPLAQAHSIPEPSLVTEVKPNAFATLNGRLVRREGDSLEELGPLPLETTKRLHGLIRVRDAIRRCLQTQWEEKSSEEMDQARVELNRAYDQFVARFGFLSERRNVSAFKGDPDLPLL
ncbi:MAG TPA: DNA methylase, partial [Verrucomicrobiales bacterium]|nr:DNA methylase [Verrucomicrobiales bacterium]